MSNAVPDTAYCYLHRRPATREPHSSGEPATRDSAIDVDHSYNMWKKALSHLAHDATTATTGHRWHRHSRQQVDDQEDDQLPSTADLERMEQEHPEEEDNFFAHPFPQEMPMPMPVAAAPAMGPMPRAKFAHISVPEDEASNDTAPQVEEGEASGDGQEARNHWGKMVDKIKLISNIQTFSGREAVTTSIAPYYSPLFEPAFIAFTKDEYGRRMASCSFGIYVCVLCSQLTIRLYLASHHASDDFGMEALPFLLYALLADTMFYKNRFP